MGGWIVVLSINKHNFFLNCKQSQFPVSGPTSRLKWLENRQKPKQNENGTIYLVVQAAECIVEGGVKITQM